MKLATTAITMDTVHATGPETAVTVTKNAIAMPVTPAPSSAPAPDPGTKSEPNKATHNASMAGTDPTTDPISGSVESPRVTGDNAATSIASHAATCGHNTTAIFTLLFMSV